MSIRRSLSPLFMLCLLAISAFAQNAAAPQAATDPQPGAVKIGVGDLVEIGVYGADDFTQKVRVASSGSIYLALIGNVPVEGLTAEQAQTRIEERLVSGGFFKEPHATVLILDFASQGVSMLGEISRPGVYPIYGTRRLFDMLSVAGGLTDKAGKNVTISRREKPNEPITIEMASDPSKSMGSNVEIYPGDTILISKAGIVYVIGEVNNASGLAMVNTDKMTVLQALALSQGPTRDAALDKAKLIRNTPEGRIEIPIPLKKILTAKAPDVPLQAEDILFVPSAARNAASRGLDAILQIATGVSIRRF